MPPVDRHDTPDWQQLRHWKYCVGGKYGEIRRKTTTAVADDVLKGFDIGAAAAGSLHLIPGVGTTAALLAQGCIVGLKWTLGALGLFTKREPAYKLIRTQFKMMFQEDVVLPIIELTKTDWCIAVPEVPSSAISLIVEGYRKHIFEKLGLGTEYRRKSPGKISPIGSPSDRDERHFCEGVDWLMVYEVDKLPHKIEWIFAFGAADEVSMDACRSVGTDLAKISANERDAEIAKLRKQGKIPGRDPAQTDPDAGEPDEGGKIPILPIAIGAGVLAFILMRK